MRWFLGLPTLGHGMCLYIFQTQHRLQERKQEIVMFAGMHVSPNLPLGPNSTTMKYKHPGEKREGRTLFTTEQLVNIPK